MHLKKIFITIALFCINIITSQEFSVNFNVNLNDSEIKQIADIWHGYLHSNSKGYWKAEEVNNLENFNIQNMPGILNPALLDWKLNNRILNINTICKNKYILKSAYLNNELEIFAVANVVVEKINNEYKLSNYIYNYTQNWNVTKTSNIKYVYTPSFKPKRFQIKRAQNFYTKLCEVFNVNPELITYFIAEDCDDIYTMLGYDFFISKGMGTECGYFESKNNFVFVTKKGGTNHYHELTHFINKFYPNANDLLLTGLSAYISGEKAHFGKPLNFHIKRVAHYLQQNENIDLSDPFSFNYMDEKTNPQYVIGALICDIILEKEGKSGLLDVFRNCSTDEELLVYLNEVIIRNGDSLNVILRRKVNEFSEQTKITNKLGF